MLPPPPKNYKISSAFSYNFILALTRCADSRIAINTHGYRSYLLSVLILTTAKLDTQIPAQTKGENQSVLILFLITSDLILIPTASRDRRPRLVPPPLPGRWLLRFNGGRGIIKIPGPRGLVLGFYPVGFPRRTG